MSQVILSTCVYAYGQNWCKIQKIYYQNFQLIVLLHKNQLKYNDLGHFWHI